MTVVAWDGKTLAADRQMTDGCGMRRPVTKIVVLREPEPLLVAMTGKQSVALELLAWLKAGAVPAEFPASAKDDDATLIAIDRDGVVRNWTCGPFPAVLEVERCAWGSGRDYAEAAMYLGHDARRAVEVACVFQSDCGNGITALTLEL